MPWKATDGGVETSGRLADLCRIIERAFEEDRGRLGDPNMSLLEYTVGTAKILQDQIVAEWSKSRNFLSRKKAGRLAAMTATRDGDSISYPVMTVLDFIAENHSIVALGPFIARSRDRLTSR